jgi:Peptidase M15
LQGVSFSVALLCCLLSPCGHSAVDGLQLGGFTIDYSPFTIVALPGEELEIGLPAGSTGKLFLDGGTAPHGRSEGNKWGFTAPSESGHYSLRVTAGDDSTTVNLFVATPASEVREEKLNGYRLGPPPPGHAKFPALYVPPTAYIEVGPELLDIQLTPHFKLRQFLCKQESDYPKYLVLKESLLVLLEGLLQAVRKEGYAVETFGVISAYRTPWYNQKIGNVANSRHVYGDAMDLFVDLDQDGNLDDLNHDGEQDREDVAVLFDIATRFMANPDNAALIGGVGRYGRTGRHGGFVHVDTRGYPARW